MKVLGTKNVFLGPPNIQKINFLQKLELYDLAEHCWGVADSILFSPALVLDKAIAPFLAVSFPTLSDAYWD